MNGNDHLRQTLEYYRQQMQKKIEELRPLELMIRQLEKELGESSNGGGQIDITPSLGDTMGVVLGDSFSATVTPRQTDIRPDEFFSMTQSEAAKAYLKKIGRAISMDQLLDALKRGGAEVGGVNPKKTLYVSLMRNPMREFVIPSENHIGLRVFYPGLPKAGKAAKPTKHKRKKGVRKTRITRTFADEAPATVKAQRSSVGSAIKEILSGGEPRTRQQIVREVQQKLGQVPAISVSGALRSKEFEESEGKFRLAKTG